MTNQVRLFGRAFVCVVERLVTFSLVILAAAAVFGEEKPRSVAKVVKLTHLAVILPESVVTVPPEPVRHGATSGRSIEEKEGMGVGPAPAQPAMSGLPERGWTPTVEQVAAAETAIDQRLKELAKSGCALPLSGRQIDVKAKYIIQYFGVELRQKRWIKCYIINVDLLGAVTATSGSDFLARELEVVFTRPFLVADCDWVLDAYYDPATNRFSESLGMFDALRPGKLVPTEDGAPQKEPVVEDPFKDP
jgi:hypothetical protein